MPLKVLMPSISWLAGCERHHHFPHERASGIWNPGDSKVSIRTRKSREHSEHVRLEI